jgi:Sec-independent protein translocase protein TatA
MDFFGMGPWEILLILVIAMILLGPGKIVGFARTLGKWVRAIKRAGNDFTAAVTREVETIEKEPPPSPPKETIPAPPQLTASNHGPGAGPDGERHP